VTATLCTRPPRQAHDVRSGLLRWLQIAHTKMLLQRKQMGGHEAYACERNAREILEFLNVPVEP
jgi:hypothetical protein